MDRQLSQVTRLDSINDGEFVDGEEKAVELKACTLYQYLQMTLMVILRNGDLQGWREILKCCV